MREGNTERVPTCAIVTEGLPHKLIDVEDLARHLSVAKGTLYNWVYLRRIPYIKVGRCLRFDLRAVLDSLSSTTMESAGKR